MGLLDIGNLLDNDQARIGLGLLAAAGPSAVPQSFGQRLMGGLLQADQIKQQQEQTAQARQFREMQMQQMALQYQQALKAQQQADLDRTLTQQAFTPVKPIEANQASGVIGPRPEALGVVGQMPKFDFGQAIGAGMTPERAMALEQALRKDNSPVKLSAGDMLVDPRTYKPLANNPKEDTTPADWKLYQLSGAAQRGLTFDQWDQARKRAGATNVTVSTEKDYSGKIAGGLADRDLQAIDAAKAAPDTIASSQRIRQILASNQAFTGTGAETRLAITKALSTAGLVNGNSVTATEDLQRELSQGVLGHIKSSGLGGGSGFSNADRDFLEKAAAGKIDVNAQTLAKTAELAERAARKSIDAGNQALKRVRSAPGVGTIPMMPDIPQPAITPAASAGGLSPAEQQELAELRARLGGKRQ